MTNYLEQIDLGLLIDEPKVFIKWDTTQTEILSLINEHGYEKVKELYYIVKVKVFEKKYDGHLGFHFNPNGILLKLEFFKNQSCADDKTIINAFIETQKLLEGCFGKPLRKSAMVFPFSKTNYGDKNYRWHFKNITILHSLCDRFGLEEHLEMLINQR